MAVCGGTDLAWWPLVALASLFVIYPCWKGDGQDAVMGASSRTQAVRGTSAGSFSGLTGVVVSQEPFVCWFLSLRRFLVETWDGYGWRRGVSW